MADSSSEQEFVRRIDQAVYRLFRITYKEKYGTLNPDEVRQLFLEYVRTGVVPSFVGDALGTARKYFF